MRGLPVLDTGETHRVRRWDAVVLGGALPGLIAAVRLGMRGARVMVLEETCSTSAFPGLREPFLMTGGGGGADGVLGPCLEALGIPLIDRRGVKTEPVAYQVALPSARVNIGHPDWTAEEFACWGLASHEEAHRLVSSLDECSATESQRLLAAQDAPTARRVPRFVRPQMGGDRSSGREADAGSARSGDPLQLAAAREPRVHALLDAQVRALSDFGERPPSDILQSRLLGASLSGAAGVEGRERWLHALLRRRIEALYGEFRNLGGLFQIVSANGLPAIVSDESPEICAARALLVNAPPAALRDDAYGQASGWLRGPDPTHRRLTLHVRGPRELLPLGMAPRIICVRDPSEPMQGTNVVRVRVYDNGEGPVDLIASAVVPADEIDSPQHLEQIGRSVVALMPLRDKGWTRVAIEPPHWDTDALLGDADHPSDRIPGLHRPFARVPVYLLDRWQTSGLGFDGDLLLGWTAGDTIAAAL